MLNFKKTTFIKSAERVDQCVPDQGGEVAFVGRSNAGKSSALNALVGRPIARVSKLPGRTQLINFFEVNDQCRLVDLPGYGFARVTEEMKKRWKKNLTAYFQTRKSLAGVVLLCDARHPLKMQDLQLIDFVLSLTIPVHLLLTKADKLSKNEAAKQLKAIQHTLEKSDLLSIQLFSSLTQLGFETFEKKLASWFLQHR